MRLPIFCSALFSLALCFVAACGSGSASGGLSPTFPDNRDEDVAAVLARLAGPSANDRPVLAGIGGEPSVVFAADLTSGQTLWTRPVTARTAPIVAGHVVIVQEERAVVGRAVESGEEVFSIEHDELGLVGASGEGDLAAFVLSTGGGVGARSKLYVARGDSIAWELESDAAFGAPAVRAGMVFLPWSNQNVSVLDGDDGTELARVRINDDVIGTAVVAGGKVYVGQASVFRFDERIAAGNRSGASSFTPQAAELPGAPAFLGRAYEPPANARAATHRIRLEWRPSPEAGAIAFDSQAIYLVFYRLVFALDPATARVRWVYAHPRDVVGASAQPGGLLFADASGEVGFLEGSSGALVHRTATNNAATAISFRAPEYAPARNVEPEPAAELPDQLRAAADNPDARLAPARVFAAKELAAIEGPSVTAHLIALCDGRSLPEGVRTFACNALTSRTDGPEALLSALERHTRFLERTTAPPISPLARAAVRMEERRAVAGLVAHLNDPATAVSDLTPILEALGALGDASTAPAIRAFLRLYHADEEDPALVTALQAAVDALVRIQARDAAPALEEIIGDPLGIAPLRGHARTALEALNAPPEEPAPEEPADPQEPAEPAETIPDRITLAIVRTVMRDAEEDLSQCLRTAPDHPASGRAVLTITPSGSLESLSVIPDSIAACVEPIVRRHTFPASRSSRREQITYTIRR